MPLCTDDNQSFPAFDHGEDLERFKVTGPWLKSGFTKIREDSRQTAASERGREVSFLLLISMSICKKIITLNSNCKLFATDNVYPMGTRSKRDHIEVLYI